MDRAELSTEQVLKWDTPWETYITTKLITGTCLQLLRRYDHKSERQRAALLDDEGHAYVRVFVSILHDIFKEETIEYVLALIDEMLTANPKRATMFHDSSLSSTGTYEPFLRWLWNGNWFIQEKSCKILSLIMSVRPKPLEGIVSNGEATHSKSTFTSINDVLNSLVEWLCSQAKFHLKEPCLGYTIALGLFRSHLHIYTAIAFPVKMSRLWSMTQLKAPRENWSAVNSMGVFGSS